MLQTSYHYICFSYDFYLLAIWEHLGSFYTSTFIRFSFIVPSIISPAPFGYV